MTRRILAGFLGVLVAMIALVEVPLGLALSAQQRDAFARASAGSAQALAAVAEERLGDRSGAGSALRLPVASGDGAVVLDRSGRQVAAGGSRVSRSVVRATAAGRRPSESGAVVETAIVGEDAQRYGTVVLVSSTGELDRRITLMWLVLLLAAVGALGVGALVAAALARWIARPVRALRGVAVRMGHGDLGARSNEREGPPELQALAAAFNDMSERIGSLLESQRIMTLDVSHQIRTPLAALRLRLEFLTDGASTRLLGELDGALREIARLDRLADGLLAVARAERREASPQTVDVAAVVRERVEMWQPVALERGVTLRAELVEAGGWLTAGNLEQVLDNLLANALDALDPARRVTVALAREAGHVLLRVVDDGPGLTEAQREAAFRRFASDHAHRSKTGLGLAIVDGLVAADHGTARLLETPGGGLTVELQLPATPVRRGRVGMAARSSAAQAVHP